MVPFNKLHFIWVIIGLLLITSSCHMGQSNFMTHQEREQLELTYDSLETAYETLMEEYEAESDSLPYELQTLYGQMQQMHQQAEVNHHRMMDMHMDRQMEGSRMMEQGMGRKMQEKMAGEWYHQLMGMHERIANHHREMGRHRMAGMNSELSEKYSRMKQMSPGAGDPADRPYNEEGDSSLLNGESLYTQNCAACHGKDAEGVDGVFPPLKNTQWITGDSSVPVRILLHGLSGEIVVREKTFQGSMPPFKARLSAAEMATILNYLRTESEGDYPEISTEDIIRIDNHYSDRITPWNAKEFDMNQSPGS